MVKYHYCTINRCYNAVFMIFLRQPIILLGKWLIMDSPINTIRRFSGYSKREEIENFVEEYYISENDTFFICNKEVTLMYLIYKGIAHFSNRIICSFQIFLNESSI